MQFCSVELRLVEGMEFSFPVWNYSLADGLDVLLAVLSLSVKTYILV
jgi:hypothetical protein